MALVYNTTEETQTIKIFGNYFTFKPGSQKNLEEKIAHNITTDKKEFGLVRLPVQFEEDAGFKDTAEGQKIMAEKRQEGLANYINHLRFIVANNQLSLRRDLEMKNIKADPAVYASEGEINAMKLLVKYQKQAEDSAQNQVDLVKELTKQINEAK